MTEKQRIRLRFEKRDRLRFISHHDLLQTFERAIRRAGFEVAYTQGFNPRPKLTFALALPLGVESYDEILDIELPRAVDAGRFLEGIASVLPPGLNPLACEALTGKSSLQVESCDYAVELEPEQIDVVSNGLERFAAASDPVITRERKGRVREIQIKQLLDGVRLDRQRLVFTVCYPPEGGLKPGEFLTWLGLDAEAVKIIKTKTKLKNSPPSTPT